MDFVRRSLDSVLELVFPKKCPSCESWEDLDADTFCGDCRAHLEAECGEEACPTCGVSVAPFEVTAAKCGRCRDAPPRIGGTVRVGAYRPYLGRMLRAYKFGSRPELEPILGNWLAKAVQAAPWRERVEAVVSVPTHWRRRMERPFHAAENLARFLAPRLDLVHVNTLRRTRAGPHQLGLSYTERARNVLGAFAIRKGVELHQARLLVVDDVRTTGATLEECAKVLRRHGAAEVYAAVVVTVGATPGQEGVLKMI